jgi:hypothetical protein
MRKDASTRENDIPENLPDEQTAGGVGLSDPHQSKARRKLLDLINRLHSIG